MKAKPSPAHLLGSSLVSSRDGGLIFGVGHNTPAFQRNYQSVQWKLANGAKICLETGVFQLDGQNINASPGGPDLPLYRTLVIKHKRLLRSSTIYEGNEFDGAFELLNCAIRSTTVGNWALDAEPEEALVRLQEYEHDHFGTMEYYGVTDLIPLEALCEFVLGCKNPENLKTQWDEIANSPESRPFLEACREDMNRLLETYGAHKRQ